MELSAVLTILRRWSPTLIASALVASVAAYFVASAAPSTYSAEARVLVGPINTDGTTLGAAQDLVQTYGSLVTADRVINLVIDELSLDIPPAALRESISGRPESVTRILTISATAGDPQLAADIANGIASALGTIASEEQTRPEGQITLVSAAQPNPESAQPIVPLIVVLASAAGLVSGLAAVLLVDYFSDTVSSRQDLQRLTDAPIIGAVNPRRLGRRRARQLVVEGEPDSAQAQTYRLIAGHIIAEGATRTLRSLVVVGAEGREGAGEVAANLAATMVRGGHRVRLVDANDEDHEITGFFRLRANRTLGEIASTSGPPMRDLGSEIGPGIDVVPSPPGRDPRLNDLGHVRAVLDKLADGVDLVIVNTAPIHRSQTAILMAREADGAILVAKRDATKRDSVTITVDSLRQIGTPLIGSILHGVWRRPTPVDSSGRDDGDVAASVAQAKPAGKGGTRRSTPS